MRLLQLWQRPHQPGQSGAGKLPRSEARSCASVWLRGLNPKPYSNSTVLVTHLTHCHAQHLVCGRSCSSPVVRECLAYVRQSSDARQGHLHASFCTKGMPSPVTQLLIQASDRLHMQSTQDPLRNCIVIVGLGSVAVQKVVQECAILPS